MSNEVSQSATGAPILEIRDLKKHFSQSEGLLDRLVGDNAVVRAVDGVDLTVHDGETLAVVGESGCGKSTLGQTILNLHRPSAGEVTYRGTDRAGLPEKEMRRYRQSLQMIFQNPLASLNPRQTTRELLVAPMEVHDIGDSDEDRLERAADALVRVGLQEQHLNRHPHEFSGGQQQRIAIARVLTLEPDFVVADEPTSALDVSVQAQLLNLLGELQDDLGLSMLFITHDLSVVRHVADRVAVMYLGKIVETAPVEELFENPRHPYTKSLLSAVPRIDPGKRSDRILLDGSVPSPLDPPSGCTFHTRCPDIVPPEGWTGTQEAFRAGFTFRTRVEEGEIHVGDVRERLEDDGDDRLVTEIVRESLPVDPETLPASARETVLEATRALIDGDDATATERLVETFSSPCARTVPESTQVGVAHDARCLRLDEDEGTA